MIKPSDCVILFNVPSLIGFLFIPLPQMKNPLLQPGPEREKKRDKCVCPESGYLLRKQGGMVTKLDHLLNETTPTPL